MDLVAPVAMAFVAYRAYRLALYWRHSHLWVAVSWWFISCGIGSKSMNQNQSFFSNGSEYLIGVLFGLGLMISGMTNPAKILAFLDLAGNWDPSLIFVMGGAVLVGLVAFYLAKKRTQSFLGGAMHIPTRRDIDRPLIVGSAMFGVGWGLAGFCPGPALVSLGSGEIKALIFVIAMVAGMWLFDRTQQKTT